MKAELMVKVDQHRLPFCVIRQASEQHYQLRLRAC